MDTYDVIVIGTGGIGSAAAYHAARRGARVLGLDRFPGGHANGSSHGETRIIRKAYYEHADYVPLLERAYTLWNDLEAATGETLFRRVGIVECGRADGSIVPGVRQAAESYHLPLENLRPIDFGGRFPFALSADMDAVFEEQAGFLFVERSVLAHLRMADSCGAALAVGDTVTGWKASEGGVTVETTGGRYQAGKLIVTAGAWAAGLLADLAIPLIVRRKHLHWYACGGPGYQADSGCPCFFYETPEGLFYGFPELDGSGVKVAEHSGGIAIADPLADNKAVDAKDRSRVEAFVTQFLPSVSTTALQHAVCYYTVSPDEHFIVDRHPRHGNVVFAAGLSGHGYKFATVLGEVLADLALDGTTSAPVGFLAADRPGLRR